MSIAKKLNPTHTTITAARLVFYKPEELDVIKKQLRQHPDSTCTVTCTNKRYANTALGIYLSRKIWKWAKVRVEIEQTVMGNIYNVCFFN